MRSTDEIHTNLNEMKDELTKIGSLRELPGFEIVTMMMQIEMLLDIRDRLSTLCSGLDNLCLAVQESRR